MQAHPLDLLKAEGLLQQIANDKLALCIIQCNKDPLTAQDVCDDAILAAMAQQAADNEQNNRKVGGRTGPYLTSKASLRTFAACMCTDRSASKVI